MGLLRNDDKDVECLQHLFQGLAQASEKTFEASGFRVQFLQRSLEEISDIATEHLFDGKRFPQDPGAFKRAAAVCLCTRMMVDVRFAHVDPGKKIGKLFTDDELDAWVARIAFMLIPMVISQCEFKFSDGKTIKPRKVWQPASFHVRMEILGLLRWLETPLDATGALDADRLAKAILALALIIEQSYYLTDSKIDCDVHDQARCFDSEDPICLCDATFLHPDTNQEYKTSRETADERRRREEEGG